MQCTWYTAEAVLEQRDQVNVNSVETVSSMSFGRDCIGVLRACQPSLGRLEWMMSIFRSTGLVSLECAWCSITTRQRRQDFGWHFRSCLGCTGFSECSFEHYNKRVVWAVWGLLKFDNTTKQCLQLQHWAFGNRWYNRKYLAKQYLIWLDDLNKWLRWCIGRFGDYHKHSKARSRNKELIKTPKKLSFPSSWSLHAHVCDVRCETSAPSRGILHVFAFSI